MPCTWRRGTVSNVLIQILKTCKTYGKIRKSIKALSDHSQSSDYKYPNPYAQMMTSYKEQNANTLNTVIKVEQDFGFVTKGLKANIWVNFKNWSSSSYNRSITPYLSELWDTVKIVRWNMTWNVFRKVQTI